jgi:hypothetical protein
MVISPLLMNYSNGTVLSFIGVTSKKIPSESSFSNGFYILIVLFLSIDGFLANDNQAKLKISSNVRNHEVQERIEYTFFMDSCLVIPVLSTYN